MLDTKLTSELVEEGYLSEIISKVQTMRKEADFEVTDHITFYYGENAKLTAIVQKYAEMIQAEVLADELKAGAGTLAAYQKEWDINGETVLFAVKLLITEVFSCSCKNSHGDPCFRG